MLALIHFCSAQRPELSDTMLDTPMQTGQPNGVRSSDWLDLILNSFGLASTK